MTRKLYKESAESTEYQYASALAIVTGIRCT